MRYSSYLFSLTFLFLIILFSSQSLYSQEEYVISGIVIGSKTNQPLKNVHVISQENNRGTSTDSYGYFNIKLQQIPAFLLFSHISFEERIIIVNKKTIKQDTLKIYLKPKIALLKEAVVTGKKIDAFKKDEYTIIDFNFMGSEILILGKNHTQKRFELFLTNIVFDTIKFMSISKAIKATEIYKDCLGNCHLLSNKKAYQIVSEGSIMYLHDAVDLDVFQEVMSTCEFETDEHMVFQMKTASKFHKEYYAIHKEGRQKKRFIRGFESEKLKALNDQRNFLATHKDFQKGGFSGNMRFERDIMYKPAFCTLEKIGDSIYYFDHSKGSIDLYTTDLKHHRSIDIEYHNYKKWKPEIYVDAVKGKSYTIIENDSKKEIYEINLLNGTIEYVFTIPIIFPRKIMINNGYVYALYKNFAKRFDWKSIHFYKL